MYENEEKWPNRFFFYCFCMILKILVTWNVLSTGTCHCFKSVFGVGGGLGKQIMLSFPIIFNTVPKKFLGGAVCKKKN